MSACYKRDSFALVLASCNFVGVPLLANPRERGLLAGSAQGAVILGDSTPALAAALPRSSAQFPFLLGSVSPPGTSACSVNASWFQSHSSTGRGIFSSSSIKEAASL